MEFLHKEVAIEYERWLQVVGPDDPYATSQTIGLREVLRAHFLIVDFFFQDQYGIGGVGPKNLDLLHSALYRQFVAFGSKQKWSSPYERCATLLFGLVKDHPFHDANKRTALLVTLYQLDKLNRTPKVSQKEFEDFIVEVADNQLAKYSRYKEISGEEDDNKVIFIADFLKRQTREIDKRHYTVTYQELDQRLRQRGFKLANPNKNYIDVVQMELTRKYLGILGPRVEKEFRVAQIGFPGWKRQVGKGAIKSVREATGLKPEKGYDSAVFFKGGDPLHTLIDIYAEPLRRLANR